MKTDIDWKGIAHCWETLVKENQKRTEILRILKKHAKIIDTYGGVHDKPVQNCDINIVIYDEDPDIEDIKAWLEGE